MILCDVSIEKLCDEFDVIRPYNIKQLQPASYDVQLADLSGAILIGSRQWVIPPKQFVLGSTMEQICLPSDIVARIEGKSSWARKGLWIHAAGWIDPGFCGTLTLEMINLSDSNIQLTEGMLIGQISFEKMDGHAKRPYGSPGLNSHYQNQFGVTPSVI